MFKQKWTQSALERHIYIQVSKTHSFKIHEKLKGVIYNLYYCGK